jgi:hypothetical protein
MYTLSVKSFTRNLFATLLLMLLGLGYAWAQAVDAPLAKIYLPPLAWSSWNSFSNTIDSDITMQQARAMVSTGLQKGGYEYINIDEGWWLGDRDPDGNFVVDPKRWPAIAPGEKPGDMANIARYIHSLGLKAGIYTDAGKDGCSMFPDIGPAYANVGSEGHYEQDFLQFAKWGFDFVKVDWCGGNKENLSAETQYGEIARAIARAEQITGKRLYYSICDWGKQSPWTWGPGVGGSIQDIWRVSGDIVAPVVASGPHTERKVAFDTMLRNFDQGIHPEAQHTGYYNDPDGPRDAGDERRAEPAAHVFVGRVRRAAHYWRRPHQAGCGNPGYLPQFGGDRHRSGSARPAVHQGQGTIAGARDMVEVSIHFGIARRVAPEPHLFSGANVGGLDGFGLEERLSKRPRRLGR